MPKYSIDEMVQVLYGLRLASRAQVDECRTAVGRSADSSALLEQMERRQYLTSYQKRRLNRGETAGLVLGNYKVIYRNASGSFARVFRAETLDEGSMVALKVLRQRWADDPKTVAGFRREARVCKRFQHRNIVPIYDVGSEGAYHYFAMEFIEGGNLRDFMRVRGKVSAVEATQCLVDMCEGLAYALHRGVTHRDLKMSNVLMSSAGVAMLVDFGLAGDNAISDSFDGNGVQRALEYATLEEGTDAPRDDPRTDLFFAGAMYYELLTGRAPWPLSRDREERKQVRRYTGVQPIGLVDPTLPTGVIRTVERLMAVDPDQRYQSPAQVLADLHQVLNQADVEQRARETTDDKNPEDRPKATILCVEGRSQHQNFLREYFSRHGYRLLLLSDPARAIARLKSAHPPDCVVFMGESIGSRVVSVFHKAQEYCEQTRTPCFVVLAQEQEAQLRPRLMENNVGRVLITPLTAKELRDTIDESLEAVR